MTRVHVSDSTDTRVQHLPWSNVTLLVPHSNSDSDSDSVAVSAANLTNFAFRPEQTILLELSSLVHDAIKLLASKTLYLTPTLQKT